MRMSRSTGLWLIRQGWAGKIFPSLPDEKFRRVGQSAAAASLPEIN